MKRDKPVHADNVPTPTPPNLTRGQATPEQIERKAAEIKKQPGKSGASAKLEAESVLKAESESRPVAGTESRPHVDEPSRPVRSRTKVQDPSESAVQTRSATDKKSKESEGKLRNQ